MVSKHSIAGATVVLGTLHAALFGEALASTPTATQAEAPPPPTQPAPADTDQYEQVPESDDEFDDSDFTFEDISEDEQALAAELSAGAKNAEGAVATVHGKVSSSDGSAVIGAFIELIGSDYLARSGTDGRYSLTVPPGVHSIEIRYDGFNSKSVTEFETELGADYELNATLTPLEGASLTLVVEGEISKEGAAGRLVERKQATEVRDIMSREEIEKSGGSSAGSVAKRMVAATVIGGRYVFIRGLGHRYGNTLFDRARVPSPDPDLRTVPLDIFPTAALSAINVQKTFSPDVPGDFAGASVQLESRPVPEQPFLTTSVSMGINTLTSFQEGVGSHSFAGPDAFGFGDMKRGLPDDLPASTPLSRTEIDTNTFLPVWDSAALEKWGQALYTATELVERSNLPPNFGAKLAYGQGWDVGKNARFGTILAAGYDNAHQTKREQIRVYSIATDENGEGKLSVETPQVDFESFETTRSVAWNALGQLGLEIQDDHEIDALVMYSRDSEDQTRVLDGVARSVSGESPVRSTRMRYTVRSLLMSRLGSKHDFGKLELDWFASLAQARRNDPAIREMLYTRATPERPYRLDTQATAAKQLYLNLVDDTRSGAVDLKVPFKQWSGLDASFKFGGWAEDKQREFIVRRFSYKVATGLEDAVPSGFGDLLNDDTIGGGIGVSGGGTQPFYIEELTRDLDNYHGRHSILAGYAKLSLPLAHWFEVSGGARVEASNIDVEPFSIFADKQPEPATDSDDGENATNAKLRDLDVLPALSLNFSLRDDMKLRVAGTRTLARPELRQLAPFIFTDFVGGFDVMGNPNLKSSRIWNADMRWEWFPSAGEVWAATIFYKYFDKPIEQVVAARPGQGLSSFRNAKRAQNLGFELEFAKSLGFITPKLDALKLGANYAYIFSRVTLAKPQDCESADNACLLEKAFAASTSRERALQGQAPHVLNAYIDLDLAKSGSKFRVLYNIVGRKIHRVSGLGAPDIFEEAQHGLDLRASQILWPSPRRQQDESLAPTSQLKLSFSASNLLNHPTRHTQGDDEIISYEMRRGQTFSLSLGWSL